MYQTDLAIIYSACGAPFGVYYFLQNRGRRKNLLWLKTFFAFAFWLPFAVRLFWRDFDLAKSRPLSLNTEKKLFSIQKQIEAILFQSGSRVSIYNFREIFERYVGLSLAVSAKNAAITEADTEFFRAAGNPDAELAAICHLRRNRRRLFFHHNSARQDFLKLIAKLSASIADTEDLGRLSAAFVKVLSDAEAENSLVSIFTKNSPAAENRAAENLEVKKIWNSEKQPPPNVNQVSTRLQPAAATTNSRGKN